MAVPFVRHDVPRCITNIERFDSPLLVARLRGLLERLRVQRQHIIRLKVHDKIRRSLVYRDGTSRVTRFLEKATHVQRLAYLICVARQLALRYPQLAYEDVPSL